MPPASTRIASAIVMATVVAGIVYAGHLAVCAFVFLLGALVYRELLNVRYQTHSNKIKGKVKRFRTISWSWFIVALHFAYGSDIAKAPMGFLSGSSSSSSSSSSMSLPAPLAAARDVLSTVDHTVASFALYSIVFVLTVASLRGTEEELRFQISQLCWSIAAICLTVMQMKWSVFNTYHGLFWIVFPAILVACNDCGAYIAGKSFGKKFITKTFFPLSPNKTWEGFIGAAVFTCIAGFFLPLYLAQFDWLRCSFGQLQLAAAAGSAAAGSEGGGEGGGGGSSLTCETSSLFTPSSTITLPFIMSATPITNIERFGFGQIAPIQIHGIIMGLFASLVAPFGGLFASVVKRAYGLKDFSDIIPGHGKLCS